MSNKNYNKMYKPANAVEEEQISVPRDPAEPENINPVDEVTAVPVELEVVDAEPKKAVETVSAIVVGCAKLNVREEPSPKADVVAVIDASNEVIIYATEGFGNYYKVCTASGIEGYCIKDFLELK